MGMMHTPDGYVPMEKLPPPPADALPAIEHRAQIVWVCGFKPRLAAQVLMILWIALTTIFIVVNHDPWWWIGTMLCALFFCTWLQSFMKSMHDRRHHHVE